MSYTIESIIKSGRSVVGYNIKNNQGNIMQVDKHTVETLAINKEIYGIKAQHYKDKILLRDDGIRIKDIPIINIKNQIDQPVLNHLNVTERSMDRRNTDNQIYNKASKVLKLKNAIITCVNNNKRIITSVIRIYTNDIETKNKVESLKFSRTHIDVSKVIKSSKEHENGTIYSYIYIVNNVKDNIEDIENDLKNIGLRVKRQESIRKIDVDILNYSERVQSTLSVKQMTLISNDKFELMSFKNQLLTLIKDYIVDIDDEISISEKPLGVKEYSITIVLDTGEVNRSTIDPNIYKRLWGSTYGLTGGNLEFNIEDVAVECDDEIINRKEQIDILKYFGLLDSSYKDPKLGEEYKGKKVKLKSFLINKDNK